MGFRINMGAPTPCRIHDGVIEVDWPEPRSYRTDLPITTEWQCNVFKSPYVYFVLWHKEKLYIGTKDGCVIIIDKRGLLLSIYSWEPPSLTVVDVGYFKTENGNTYLARSILEEPRLILIEGLYRTFVLNEGLTAAYFDPSIRSAEARDAWNLRVTCLVRRGLGATLLGGETVEEEKHGHWEITSLDARNDAIRF